MRFVFLSYHYSPNIHSPKEWTDRINFYVGSLASLSREHTVIRVDQINYIGDFVYNGIQYHCVDDGRKKNYFPRKLNRFVKSLQPDVVWISSFLFPLQVIQLRRCLGKKIKIIIQHHAERPFTGIRKLIQLQASRSVDAYVFTSHEIGRDWVQRGNLVNENKIYEIVEGTSSFYPIDKEMAKGKTGAEGHPVYLWAGRFNANKDPLTVVKAFLKFAGVQPAARLFMIYQTIELYDEVNKLITEEKNNPGSVVLIGKVPYHEMLYWFNSADFLVSGSHYEGSGTAVCDAMSCGCIPVVTSIPSFSMITNGGDCGLLFEAGNEQALLMALQETLRLNREEKRKKSLDYFKNELSFDAISRKIQEMTASL